MILSKVEVYRTLLLCANRDDLNVLINKFEEADRKYNSGLFEQTLSEEIIRNLGSVFWTIIRELYYPESPYSFSVFSSDILGNIYEIFLSEKLVKQGRKLALEKKPDNIDKDIIATPRLLLRIFYVRRLFQFVKGKLMNPFLTVKLLTLPVDRAPFFLKHFSY